MESDGRGNYVSNWQWMSDIVFEGALRTTDDNMGSVTRMYDDDLWTDADNAQFDEWDRIDTEIDAEAARKGPPSYFNGLNNRDIDRWNRTLNKREDGKEELPFQRATSIPDVSQVSPVNRGSNDRDGEEDWDEDSQLRDGPRVSSRRDKTPPLCTAIGKENRHARSEILRFEQREDLVSSKRQDDPEKLASSHGILHEGGQLQDAEHQHVRELNKLSEASERSERMALLSAEEDSDAYSLASDTESYDPERACSSDSDYSQSTDDDEEEEYMDRGGARHGQNIRGTERARRNFGFQPK